MVNTKDKNNKKTTYFISLRWIITTLIILIGILAVLIPFIFYKTDPDNVKIEKLYYLSQIVSSLFVGIGVLIAGWQYIIVSRSELATINITQIQKAIDLSAFYKDNILKVFIAINYVYENTGIKNILNSIDPNKIINFDEIELKNLLTITQRENLKEIQHSNIFVKVVLEANDIYDLNLHFQKIKVEKSTNDNGKDSYCITYDKGQIILSFMNSIVTNLLNDMEFFALHFSHKTADDSVIYQSLHQTYLEIVQLLYYNIAKDNEPGQSKYYTNIIDLYTKWYKLNKLQLEKIAEGQRKNQYKGTSVPPI